MTGIRELFVTHKWPDLAYDCEKVQGIVEPINIHVLLIGYHI